MKGYLRKIEAYRHFFPECNGKCKEGWVLHHKDIKLKYNDPRRYYEWRIEDLMPMLRKEHFKLHSPHLLRTEESFKKISNSQIGKQNSFYGRHQTEEARERISKASIGKHYVLGYHWWNNGKECKTSIECPGEDWVRGRFIKKEDK